MATTVMSEQEIRERLDAQLPRWVHDDGHLVRVFETGNWQRTLLLANGIGFLAEAAWHHPDLHLSFPALTVRLQTHDAGGVTARDFELAFRIEELATWQPSPEASLTGPPSGWFL